MATKVGVILSGCGYRDGAEIQESVLTLLALDRAGAEAVCFAPDVAQAQVVDHATGKPTGERRNVLTESARLTHEKVTDVAEADARSLDALILPGGYGVTQNLCTFAADGEKGKVDPGVARLVRAMHAAKKPIGAICIAPALIALLLGKEHVRLTIGNDAGTAKKLTALGAVHVDCPVDAHVVDADQRIASTPAYMLGPSIRHVAEGIERCVKAVLEMARKPVPAAR